MNALQYIAATVEPTGEKTGARVFADLVARLSRKYEVNEDPEYRDDASRHGCKHGAMFVFRRQDENKLGIPYVRIYVAGDRQDKIGIVDVVSGKADGWHNGGPYGQATEYLEEYDRAPGLNAIVRLVDSVLGHQVHATVEPSVGFSCLLAQIAWDLGWQAYELPFGKLVHRGADFEGLPYNTVIRYPSQNPGQVYIQISHNPTRGSQGYVLDFEILESLSAHGKSARPLFSERLVFEKPEQARAFCKRLWARHKHEVHR